MGRRISRGAAIVGIAGIVAVAAAVAFAVPAVAHNFYVSSTPGINETLTTLPDQFVVTTNDNLLELGGTGGGFFMEVTGPDGLYYGDGCVTVSGPSVSTPAALGPAGDYTLTWQVVSTDGHTVSDTIPFRWQPAAGAESTTKGSPTVPTCGADALNSPPPAPVSADNTSTDILWIGGAVVAIALAALATVLLIRPRRKAEEPEPDDESGTDA
ncbi:MAG: copper resistance protein CopC [Cryobacterium sp.]|nr:copper resistance protein CopC [Cryobacterium sp.]